MNFLPVPPGTPLPAATLLRGDEPEIVVNVAHNILACASSVLKPIPCPTAGHGFRRVQNANMLMLLGDSLFISNPVGLTFSVALHGVPPQRLQTLWDRLVTDGFDVARVYANAGEFLVEAARIVDALDYDTLHVDYIFTPAEVMDKEPPNAVVGVITVNQLVAASWTRELTFRDLATPVSSVGHPDLHRLSCYGSFSYFTPGTYTSLGRDTPPSPLRMAMVELRDQAEQLRVGNCAVNAMNQGAARAVGTFFRMTIQPPNLAVYADVGDRDYLARRTADLTTRGMLASSNPLACRATIAAHLHLMSASFGSLLALLTPLPPAATRLPLLDRLFTSSGEHRSTDSFKSLHDLAQLNALVEPRIPTLNDWAATHLAIPPTPLQRIDRFLLVLEGERSAERNAGRGGGGGVTGTGTGVGGTSGSSALTPGSSVAAKMLTVMFNERAFILTARAAMQAIQLPGAGRSHATLASRLLSRCEITIVRKFALGFQVNAATLPPCLDLFATCATALARWVDNLSFALMDHLGTGVLTPSQSLWRIDAKKAEHIRHMRFSQINWEQLAGEVKGAVDDMEFRDVPSSHLYTSAVRIQQVILPVVRRLEAFMGVTRPLPALAVANTLASAFDHVQDFLTRVNLPGVLQTDYLAVGPEFVYKMLEDVESNFAPIFRSSDTRSWIQAS